MPGAIPSMAPRTKCRNLMCDAPAIRLMMVKGAIGSMRTTTTAIRPRLAIRRESSLMRLPAIRRTVARPELAPEMSR